MANNAQYNVLIIGTIKIKTYDSVVRTLSNVCHVLDLKRNFISLGTLEFMECKYSSKGGVLKVSKALGCC